MADDDEIDVLGDLSLPFEGDPNLLENSPLVSQNSDLLHCDYTIHPQWLLDRPSTNPDNWYNETSATTTPDASDSDSMGQVTENCITDESGWTEKEKNLLQRGLEIFGKSCDRLAQFIGSRAPSEVRYYLKNFFTENLRQYNAPDNASEDGLGFFSSDVIHSDQIPASMEEVIASVNTGTPTVVLPKPKKKSDPNKSKYLVSPKKCLPKQKVVRRKCIEKAKSRAKKVGSMPKHKAKVKEKVVPSVVDEAKESIVNEISTGRGLAVPVYEGEKIVKIQSADDDGSDISIDIEEVDEHPIIVPKTEDNIAKNEDTTKDPVVHRAEETTNEVIFLPPTNEEIIKQLNTLEEPETELILNTDNITDLEKYVHSDYFKGHQSRTPERYLKIRNHIINNWKSSKPNYIVKTQMRQGLKHCGDVGYISRIHYFLEQIGAINFGCEQTKYDRPLMKMLQLGGKGQSKANNKGKQRKVVMSRELTELGPRQRVKKRFENDGEGGLTMVHDEKGEVIYTKIIHEEPSKTSRSYVKKPTIRLTYCKQFPPDNPQKHSVKLAMSTLLLMDLHSHCYLTEVMGLVGGTWDSIRRTLAISCYVPCKNIASSATHCDMCPISQARAAEIIHGKNYEILGWFHSHPTFAPEPSQQDLDTQRGVQQWIGHDKPCIGVILSPFSVNAALISSPFRLWMVDRKMNFEDQWIPYRYKVDVTTNEFDLPTFLAELKSLLRIDNEDSSAEERRVAFQRPYFQDTSITHLEKFISSVNMHLAKTALSEQKCQEIVRGIKDMIQNLLG